MRVTEFGSADEVLSLYIIVWCVVTSPKLLFCEAVHEKLQKVIDLNRLHHKVGNESFSQFDGESGLKSKCSGLDWHRNSAFGVHNIVERVRYE